MKNVVITGAGGQLGKAFVGHLLKDKQYKVYALDLNFTNLNISTNAVEYVNVNITNEQEVVSFYKTLNSIDVLINNAGIGAFTPFEDRTVEDFMNVVDVNMKGTFLMCREARITTISFMLTIELTTHIVKSSITVQDIQLAILT